jgi:hypothetical protein
VTYHVQWILSNPTHHKTREMCQIVQDIRTCLIRHTMRPGKCVRLYRISEYSGFILVNRNTLGPWIFCRMSQDVGLRKFHCILIKNPLPGKNLFLLLKATDNWLKYKFQYAHTFSHFVSNKLIVVLSQKHIQGSILTVVRLPGASEMRLRASENGTQLVRSGKWKWFCDMFNSWRAKWLILNYSVLEVAANFT